MSDTSSFSYPDVLLCLEGEWVETGAWLDITNPATGGIIGRVAKAGPREIERAVRAAVTGFDQWRQISAFERAAILHRATGIIRQRLESIARIVTTEQGKPLAESKSEILGACDTVDWFAEEGRRAYGQIVPSRAPGVLQMVLKDPVGPVVAFSPWNFPINQAMRKIGTALAAGCSIILKGPEDTPAGPAEIVRALHEAGVPKGVVSLLYGKPSEISAALIPHPAIRKISFTGSTAVGKELASLAGRHMKRMTMELGGHAPAIVCADADLDLAVRVIAAAKFRNAGQVCTAPTRILVQRPVFQEVLGRFLDISAARRVGDGLREETTMGPLIHSRRVADITVLLEDARQKGATFHLGGERLAGAGSFFAPTVLTGLTQDMRLMNEEPFGPVAMLLPFDTVEEALAESGRLDYGLASYAFTHSLATATMLTCGMQAGMLTINHNGLALPEVPFGGIKDSGYGTEGGSKAINDYINERLVSLSGLT
jgi:succinate-semialdehyde dehydrogenase/glutarate-semialdehyde dehydrogenase